MTTGTRHVVAAVLAGSGFFAHPALAQAAEESRSTPSASIVVTALKRSEQLSSVPAPVSVISGEQVRRGAITTAERLADFSVSLTVLPNPTANIVFLRGVGNFTLNPSSDPAIGWNYDGVFVARANGTQGQFFDLDRIEVLKGPQGVLYGRNASGGTINLIPNQPRPSVTEGRLTASYASHDAINAEGAINLPLGPNGAMRVAGQLLSQDSLLTGFAGSRQRSLRMQMKTELTPQLAVRMAGDFMHQFGVGQGTTYLGYYLFDAEQGAYRLVPSGLDFGTGNRAAAAQAFRQTVPLVALGRPLDAQAAVPYQDNRLFGALADISANLGFATLNVLPAWRYSDFDQNPPGAPFGYNYLETADQRSVEARLSSRPGQLSWLLGGILFDEDVHSRYTQNFSSQLSLSNSRYGTRSRAAYANATIEVLPGLRAVGGIRRSWDAKSLAAVTTSYTITCNVRVAGRAACPTVPLLQLGISPGAAGLPVPVSGSPLPILVGGTSTGAVIARGDRIDDARTANFSVTTWRAGFEADFVERGVAYANVQKGYRPGGLNTATGFDTYAPEHVIAYTLGARFHSPGNRIALAGEAFWWDYRDQQVSSVQPDLSASPRNVNFTRNIGRSRIRGFEVDAQWRPLEQTHLFANAQYLDSRYRDFTFLQVSANVPPLTGCIASPAGTPSLYSVDCSGQRPFASPKWSLNTGVRQSLTRGSADVDVMMRGHYVSAQNVGAAFLSSQVVPGRWTVDGQAIARFGSGQVELSVFAYNIFDKRVPTFVIFHPTSNLVVATVSQARSVGARMGLRFW